MQSCVSGRMSRFTNVEVIFLLNPQTPTLCPSKLPGQRQVPMRPGRDSNPRLRDFYKRDIVAIPHALVFWRLVLVLIYQYFPPRWARCPALSLSWLLTYWGLRSSHYSPQRVDGIYFNSNWFCLFATAALRPVGYYQSPLPPCVFSYDRAPAIVSFIYSG